MKKLNPEKEIEKMKFFIVEGIIKDAGKMNDSIMREHMAYTQEAMDRGMTFMAGLKSDNSGGISIQKAEDETSLKHYLDNEPFYIHGIQEYRVMEFDAHYINENGREWFKR